MDTDLFVEVINMSAEFAADLKTYFINTGHISKHRDIDLVAGTGAFLNARNLNYIVSMGRLHELAAKDLEMRVILTKHGY